MAATATNNDGSVSKVYPLKQPTRKVRAIAIPGRHVQKKTEKAEPPEEGVDAKSQEPSIWDTLTREGRVIAPPFDPLFLASLSEASSDLGHMIEAMVTNVVGYGWSLDVAAGVLPEVDADPVAVEAIEVEWERTDSFLRHGNWDPESLTECRRHQRTDYEAVGYSFLEVVQTPKGEALGYVHAPAHRVRLAPQDPDPVLYSERIVVGRGTRRRIDTQYKRRRFRRFVHVDPWSNQLVYFKELDDPRPISRLDGKVLTGDAARDPRLLANPMLYRRIYAPRTPYGVPRYIGSLLAILGSRAAEEVNYTTLANNQIPSMLLLVSNGQLTSETIDRITEFSEDVIGGDDNRSRFLIVEAEPDSTVDGSGSGGQVKIEAKPLREAQHDDALFVNYETANLDKMRRSWRLPPIISGSSSDYTRSTSDTSRKLAEEQVFEPERREEDWAWNRILRTMGVGLHEFKSNSPNVTNDEDLIRVMAAAEKSGAMTPRIANSLLADILGMPIALPDEDVIPLDVPFSATMAEMVQNKAKPNEPGQQVTALKADDLVAVRDRLVHAFALRERVLKRGSFAGFVVDTVTADRVLAGVDLKVEAIEESLGGTYALCDDTHVRGVVELSDPTSLGDGRWSYEVEAADAADPLPHTLSAAPGTFVERATTRGGG